MEGPIGIDLKEWKRWRGHTIATFYFAAFCYGLSFSIYYPTEYLYIKQVGQNIHPALYFALATGFGYGASFLAIFVGSIYYDFTLDAKRGVFINMILVLIGNILYSLPYSLALIMIGNFLIQTLTACLSINLSEIMHVVEEEHLTRTTAILVAFKLAGTFIGPALSFFFVQVDVSFHGWRLNFGNMPSAVMAGITLLYTIVHCIFMKNTAKIYDLKAHKERQKISNFDEKDIDKVEDNDMKSEGCDYEKDSLIETKSQGKVTANNSIKEYFKTALKVVTGRHYAFTLLASALTGYCNFLVLNLFTLISIESLSWKPNQVALLRINTMSAGLLSTAIVMIISKKVKDFVILYISVCTTILPITAVAVLPHIKDPYIQGILLHLTACVTGFVDAPLIVSSTVIIAKIVPSQYQGIAEAVRNAAFFLFFALSALSVSWVYHYLTAGCLFCIFLCIVSATLLACEVAYFMGKK